jgi:hypothetical protein
MESIDMSANAIFRWQKKCNNYKNINLQSDIIVNKHEIYWSKLNNWTNTNSPHVLASIWFKSAMASKLVPNIATTRVATKARLKVRDSYSPSLPPTFSLKSKSYFFSTQINPFFLLLIHNYHNSTFKRSKQTSNCNPHMLTTIELLISFYVWSLAFSFEQNPLENNNRPNY